MAENCVLWLTWSIINAVLWISVKSDDSSRSIARQSTQVTSKQGRQQAFYGALNDCLEWLLMFKPLCATSDRNMCLFIDCGVFLKLYKIRLSEGLKSELCRLEKTFKIIKPNCSRKTKQPFFGISMVWNALIRMWFTLHIPVMLYTHLQFYGSFPSFPLSKSKLLLSVVGVWFWFKSCPYLRTFKELYFLW